jgi:preprotein translocase subunit SecF
VFQILSNPSFNFMGKRRLFLAVSAVVVAACLGVLLVKPLLGMPAIKLGIEFTGGTEIQIEYADTPDIGDIRARLKDAGLGTPVVTTIGDPSLNEVYIRLGTSAEGSEGDLSRAVVLALRSQEDRDAIARGLANLNEIEEGALRDLLAGAPGMRAEQAGQLATEIAEIRREDDVITGFDVIEGVDGMTPAALDYLRSNAFVGEFALRSQSYIGPSIGKELMNKALGAILGSLAGVLVYIGLRFQFQWGVAALVALAHDTIVTLGLFSLFGQEMTLPVVAAFLTLIGYSVNDSVVVFDRIRENIKLRGSQNLASVVNRSINQTLSRTVITSGSTWVVVLGLYLFGGEALRSFSFVLTVGVVVGTYSSICIASPILVLWKESTMRRKGIRVPADDGSDRGKGAGSARKVSRPA